mgnify:CR=1 FL=1
MNPVNTRDALWTPVAGGTVERDVAFDMARRSLPFIPAVLLVTAIAWGPDGAASAAYAIGLVLVNLTISALLLGWAARRSLALLMGMALFGYILRLAFITAAVLLVKDAGWVDIVALGMTIIVTHLGLLFWETRYVSVSLAYPGVKPRS